MFITKPCKNEGPLPLSVTDVFFQMGGKQKKQVEEINIWNFKMMVQILGDLDS